MHVQIVTFNLKGLSHEAWSDIADQVAPTYATVPGLISKVWLEDRAANRYGGVLTWRDRQAMEEFAKTDQFKATLTNPNLAELSAIDFAVMDAPTRVTAGALAAIA